MTYKIALTSTGPLSGKTTLATYLRDEQGFMYASHSRSIVQSYVDSWNAHSSYQLTVEYVYANKEFFRQPLQRHGDDVGFNDPKLMVRWVKYTLKDWLKYKPQRNVVFEAVRGEDQAQVLRDMGFIIVQLVINEDERRARAIEKNVGYDAISSSMSARPDLELGILAPDLTLNGANPVDVQWKIIKAACDVASRLHRIDIFGSIIHKGDK